MTRPEQAFHGHSGATLRVDGNTVTKVMLGARASTLRSSALAQAQFVSPKQCVGNVRAASVRSIDVDLPTHFAFSMELANGVALGDLPKAEAYRAFGSLTGMIEARMLGAPVVPVPAFVIQSKLAQIESALALMADLFPPANTVLREAVRFCRKRLDGVCLPSGPCHGDLTFSNMRIGGDRVVLFDFGVHWFSSPLWDCVKLMQETRHEWSALWGTPLDPEWLAEWDLALERCYDPAQWGVVLNALDVFSLLRIAPYCTERRVAEWLEKEVETCLRSS